MKAFKKVTQYPKKDNSLRWWYIEQSSRMYKGEMTRFKAGHIILSKTVYNYLIAHNAKLAWTRQEDHCYSVMITEFDDIRYTESGLFNTLAEVITGFRGIKRGPFEQYVANDFTLEPFQFDNYGVPSKNRKLTKTQVSISQPNPRRKKKSEMPIKGPRPKKQVDMFDGQTLRQYVDNILTDTKEITINVPTNTSKIIINFL
jgi:hypothetical protein